MYLQAKGRSGSNTSKPSCCTRRSYIFRIFFRYNCLLHISINYTENVTDLYAHAQTVDTRCSSLIFQAPGYEASRGREKGREKGREDLIERRQIVDMPMHVVDQ